MPQVGVGLFRLGNRYLLDRITSYLIMQHLVNRIGADPRILAGKPTVRGLRISVDQILRSLAAGITHEELLRNFPELEKDDIHACLLYAADSLEHERVTVVA